MSRRFDAPCRDAPFNPRRLVPRTHPAGGGETLADPCDKWFCSPAKAAGTQFFAAQWSRATNASIYPMAWDVANLDVPGVDRTAYYQEACGAC